MTGDAVAPIIEGHKAWQLTLKLGQHPRQSHLECLLTGIPASRTEHSRVGKGLLSCFFLNLTTPLFCCCPLARGERGQAGTDAHLEEAVQCAKASLRGLTSDYLLVWPK